MLVYPEIDPVAFSLGPLKVHWYGLTYLVGFVAAWAIGVYRSRQPWSPLSKGQIEDLIFYCALGVVIGGRFGYVFLYNFDQFKADPAWLFRVWEGGMAFHGGLIGVILAVVFFARKTNNRFIDVMDFVAPMVPIGLGCGRIGNFIGQELWGRASDVSWAMVFPKADELARHPSQLYQAFLEGLVLFVIMFWFSAKPRPRAAVSALFILCYGIFRFAVEFTREPDAHIQFDLFGWMTRGQMLSLPMIVLGIVIFIAVMVKGKAREY